jgi:hypothetical protein
LSHGDRWGQHKQTRNDQQEQIGWSPTFLKQHFHFGSLSGMDELGRDPGTSRQNQRLPEPNHWRRNSKAKRPRNLRVNVQFPKSPAKTGEFFIEKTIAQKTLTQC